MYKKSMHLFVEHYEMEEVMQEETLMRAFQRWRKLVRENKNSYEIKKREAKQSFSCYSYINILYRLKSQYHGEKYF